MIAGATLYKGYNGEERQKCLCGVTHPAHYFFCNNCKRTSTDSKDGNGFKDEDTYGSVKEYQEINGEI